jgi:outer membrane protein, heavy metal efflux system
MPRFRALRAPIVPSAALAALLAAAHPAVAQDAALTEDAAIAQALAREGLAARDEADRAAAVAEADVIGPLDNPSVELSHERVNGETEWQLGVVQPIDLSGQRGALRAAARAEAEAVGSDIERRRQQLIAETRRAYVACAAGGAGLRVRESHVAALAEALRVSSARAEAGDTAVYDVRRVRVAQRAAEAELAQARGERAGACAMLASMTGISDPQVTPAAMTDLAAGIGPAARADLAAREQRVLAASQRVRAAERARIPQFAVGAGVKRVDDGLSSAYGPVVSLGVTLPIWNGGGAAVRRERARLAGLEAELAIESRRIEAEQQAAAARVGAAQEAAVAAASARADAARLGTIAQTAYEAGEIGVVELVDAYEAARDAELSVIALALSAAEAAVDYDLATGRTYP